MEAAKAQNWALEPQGKNCNVCQYNFLFFSYFDIYWRYLIFFLLRVRRCLRKTWNLHIFVKQTAGVLDYQIGTVPTEMVLQVQARN
jgi:hypothetical protein